MGAEVGGAAPRRRTPRWAVALGVLVAVAAAMAVGGRLDHAETTGSYRTPLPPAPFGGICDPLPEGVALELPVQLRSDRWLESAGRPVRRVTLHYDLREEREAEAEVGAALRWAGFRPVRPADGADPAVERWFERADYGRVGVTVTPFDVDPGTVVRGRLDLDLPPDSLDDVAASACTDYVQTKRFPPGLDTYDDE